MKKLFLQKIILTTALAAMGLVSFAQTTDYGTNPTGTYKDPQIVRYNAAGITYTVANTEGTKASFNFTVTGGTITSATGGTISGGGTTAKFTDILTTTTSVSITVLWSNTNKASSNKGKIDVTKTVDFGGGYCGEGGTQTSNIESWTLPLAKVDPTTFSVCSGVAPASIPVTFEGNAGTKGYQYKWKVTPALGGTPIEDHTSTFNTASGATENVNIAAITNTTGAPVLYKFEITAMEDAFSDKEGDVTSASVTFTVNPVPTVGPITSVPVITERP